MTAPTELDETPAEEFSRLIIEFNEGERQNRNEAWNLIADFACEHSDTIIRALSQPQAGEPVAMQWRKLDRVMKHEDVWSYVDYHTGLKIAEHPEKYETRPLYASPQPANPAQVTDAMVEAAKEAVWNTDAPEYMRDYLQYDNIMRAALTAAIGAGGQAVAEGEQEWHRIDGPGSILLYTLMQDGWRKGEPVMVNDVMVRIEAANGSETPIEQIAERILSTLSNPPAQPGWRSMDSAPNDGTKIQVWADGYEWPEIIYYERYDDATAAEAGSDGYWRYADNLFADVAEVEADTLNYWQPLPAAPQPKGDA